MAYPSTQLFFKFACVVLASLVTFAGVLMSMDLLRQMSDKDTDPSWSPRASTTRLRLIDQMEEYEGCEDHSYGGGGDGDDDGDSGGPKAVCCRMKYNRKWGPLSPPPFHFLDGHLDLKLRMTPAAARNHPYLRRTPGIDYSNKSNSTNYIYLYPDSVPAPLQAPEPSDALPPLSWDDYQQPYYAPWENKVPQIIAYPSVTNYSYEDVEPPTP